MDWNAIGAIGELGGAVGVIVTLLYLAGQLRQNTSALKSASYENWNTQVAEFGHYQGNHAKALAEVRAIEDLEQLTPEQMTYLLGEFQIVLSQSECAFLKHRAGLLDDDVFEARTLALSAYFGEFNLMARQLWREGGARGYTADFVRFVDERLQAATAPAQSIWERIPKG